jgi:hypothetical protein
MTYVEPARSLAKTDHFVILVRAAFVRPLDLAPVFREPVRVRDLGELWLFAHWLQCRKPQPTPINIVSIGQGQQDYIGGFLAKTL